MSKKRNKGRSQIKYYAKKRKEAERVHAVEFPKLNGSHEGLRSIKDGNHVNGRSPVVEDFSPRDLSQHTFNWKGGDEDPMMSPNLIRDGNLEGMFDRDLGVAISKMDEESRREAIEYINLSAQGKEVPNEMVTKITRQWNSKLANAMDIEAIHRWHDFRPRNGSLGKERG